MTILTWIVGIAAALVVVFVLFVRWHNNQMDDAWPFDDPRNVASFCLRQIMDGSSPILLVCHDDDGRWQFLDGENVSMADALLVGLSNVVSLDPSVRELADLPVGWQATRRDADSPWHREPNA